MKIDTFLDYLCDQDRSERTIAGYAHDLNAFAEWFKQIHRRAPRPASVTPLDIREYRKHLTDTKKMKPASVNRLLAALRAYFSWARETGLIATSPTNGIRSIAQGPRAPHWLDREETYALLRAAREAIQLAEAKGLVPSANLARRDAAIVAIMINAGLRVSEVCALNVDDVKPSARSGQVTVRQGKGRKFRIIPLNRDARKALQEWRKVRPPDAGELLFIGRRGEPLRPRGVQRAIKQLASAAKLDTEQVTPHALRHTFGKNLVDANVSLDRVAILMGHANLNTTAIYTTPSDADLAAAVESIAWEDM